MTASHAIEELLIQCHADESALKNAVRLYQCHGLGADCLPDARSLRAIALLGDHERGKCLKSIQDQWEALQDRGLTNTNAPEEVSTPLLRLLCYTLPHLESIPPLADALNVDEAPPPEWGVFRCPDKITSAYWGRLLLIPFSAHQVEALRIHADEVFALAPIMLRAVNGTISGQLKIPADTGSLFFTLLSEEGQVFRHELSLETTETMEEWQ